MIVFYFYLHCCHIQYNFCSKNYLLLLVYNNLQKVLNVPNYSSVFDCFLFFFQSNKISYIFKCVVIFVIYLFFLSLKRFLTSLIKLSSLFFSSESKRAFFAPKILLRFLSWAFCHLNCSILIMMWKTFKKVFEKTAYDF